MRAGRKGRVKPGGGGGRGGSVGGWVGGGLYKAKVTDDTPREDVHKGNNCHGRQAWYLPEREKVRVPSCPYVWDPPNKSPTDR